MLIKCSSLVMCSCEICQYEVLEMFLVYYGISIWMYYLVFWTCMATSILSFQFSIDVELNEYVDYRNVNLEILLW